MKQGLQFGSAGNRGTGMRPQAPQTAAWANTRMPMET